MNEIKEDYHDVEPAVIQHHKDNVNHPSHYEKSCSLECIDVMQAMFGPERLITFCLMNSFKYLWRHKNKNGKEDLDKANWYLEKANDTLKPYTLRWDLVDSDECDFVLWANDMICKIRHMLNTSVDKFSK